MCPALSTIGSKDISKTTGWILTKLGMIDPRVFIFGM